MLCWAFFIFEASTLEDSAALEAEDMIEVSDRSERSLKTQICRLESFINEVRVNQTLHKNDVKLRCNPVKYWCWLPM